MRAIVQENDKTLKRSVITALSAWLLISIVSFSLYAISRKEISYHASLFQQCCMLLVGVSFLVLSIREKHKRYTAISLNFFCFSGIVQTLETATFLRLPELLWSDRFVVLYQYQYLTCGLLPLTQFFAILFAVLVLINKQLKLVTCYLVSGMVLVAIGAVLYYPYVQNARHLYTVQDISDFRIVDRGSRDLADHMGKKPSVEQVAETIALLHWGTGRRALTNEEKIDRVREILPYTEGKNYLLLLMRPIHKNVLFLNIACMVTLFVYLLVLYLKDPPSPPYLDRILFVFLGYSTIQAFHFLVYSRMIYASTYEDVFRISSILSFAILLLLPPLVLSRLRFILSAEGSYYQSKIEVAPLEISRWRDGIDSFVIRLFFGQRSALFRRFAKKSSKCQVGENG